jgi:hypothetical protein
MTILVNYRYLIAAVVSVILLSTLFYAFKFETPRVVTQHNFGDLNSILEKEVVDTVVLKLDSATSPFTINYYELSNETGKPLLTFLNRDEGAIYRYNLSTLSLYDVVPLKAYGFSEKDKIQGFHFMNKDSVLIYNYTNAELTLLSLKGGKIFKRSLYDYTRPYEEKVYPNTFTGARISYEKSLHHVYLVGFYSDELGTYAMDKLKNVFTAFDLKTGQIRYDIHYPELYWGINWGGVSGFRKVFYDLNERKNLAVFSFMADHTITVHDTKIGKTWNVNAGSRYFDSISSLPYDQLYFEFMKKGVGISHYLHSPSYGAIIYDRYRDLYYRIAEQPVKQGFNPEQATRYKTKSIIVLNRDFERLGEALLPVNTYDTFNFFVGPKGIYFRRFESSDEQVTFHALLFKPISS